MYCHWFRMFCLNNKLDRPIATLRLLKYIFITATEFQESSLCVCVRCAVERKWVSTIFRQWRKTLEFPFHLIDKSRERGALFFCLFHRLFTSPTFVCIRRVSVAQEQNEVKLKGIERGGCNGSHTNDDDFWYGPNASLTKVQCFNKSALHFYFVVLVCSFVFFPTYASIDLIRLLFRFFCHCPLGILHRHNNNLDIIHFWRRQQQRRRWTAIIIFIIIVIVKRNRYANWLSSLLFSSVLAPDIHVFLFCSLWKAMETNCVFIFYSSIQNLDSCRKKTLWFFKAINK